MWKGMVVGLISMAFGAVVGATMAAFGFIAMTTDPERAFEIVENASEKMK